MKAEIESSKTILKTLTADDTNDLMNIYGDPDTMEFGSDPVFTSQDMVEQLLKSIADFEKNGFSYEWGIVEKETQRVIGTCGLHSFTPCRTRCEVGCLLNSDYWRLGYMSDALTALFSHAASIDITELVADIDSKNTRSIGLFTKLGFIRQPSSYLYILPLRHAMRDK
ncbi:GNAT family N-acetyltransferase [Veronia pacifica]|uniref:GNAT family N-acetyltransferase n=1 Tax=Veronia pacifica TaxID=1080227 RepID=UPI0009F5CFDB|nr:GNAT family N-acetyltransferase [Veronia pacifica]